MILCDSRREVLASFVSATKAEIEFNGKNYDQGEQGKANCRELLKRS